MSYCEGSEAKILEGVLGAGNEVDQCEQQLFLIFGSRHSQYKMVFHHYQNKLEVHHQVLLDIQGILTQ